MPESQKLDISEDHLKSKSAKTFMSNKPNWYRDWNFPFFRPLKVWEHFSHSFSCLQWAGEESMFKLENFHIFQWKNREWKTMFKFAKCGTFLRRNLQSKTWIYIFLCCAVFEEANEVLYGNNIQLKKGLEEATVWFKFWFNRVNPNENGKCEILPSWRRNLLFVLLGCILA